MRFANHGGRWPSSILAVLCLAFLSECRSENREESAPGKATGAPVAGGHLPANIRLSFKLDPRLAGGTYGGERWVSRQVYASAVQPGPEITVEAKVLGLDENGKPLRINPQWAPADPQMVVVSPVVPGQFDHVRISVKHLGESKLTVASEVVAQELLVRAKSVAKDAMQVEILQ